MTEKNKFRKFFPLLLILTLVCILGASKSIAATLEVDDQSAPIGDLVSFTISANNAPNEVKCLGVDIGYNPNVLEYIEADFSGTLLEDFAQKMVSNPSIGLLRLGAFDPVGFPEGRSGALVKLEFTVIGEQDCELPLSNLKDHIAEWSTKDGSFIYFGIDPDAATLLLGETQVFKAVGGLAPFTWSIVDDDGTKGSLDQTEGEQVTYTAPELVPAGPVTIQVEDSADQRVTAIVTVEAADLQLDDQKGKMGADVTFTLSINEAPNEVAAFGMEITYNPNVLKYKSCDRTDTLVANFDYAELSNPTAGRLIFGGFEAGEDDIPSGASGAMVKLTFTVINGADDTLILSELKDHIADWSTKDGFFTYLPVRIDPERFFVQVGATEKFRADGGLAPFTWSIVDDDGTKGSLDQTEGEQVTYTAPELVPAGPVTIQVIDDFGDEATATVNVYDYLAVDPPTASVKVNDTEDFQAVGGLAPFTWSIVDDDGTKGTLDPTEGEQVTYTAPAEAPTGGLAVTIQVGDSAGHTAEATVNFYEKLGIYPTSATVNVGETVVFAARGGLAPFTWSIIGDEGSLSATAGEQVSCTVPAEAAGHTVTIRVEDDAGQAAQATVTVQEPHEGGGGGGGGGGCFIATAAFRPPVEGHVEILLQFRDVFLLPTTLRRTFVGAYYGYLPPVADCIAGHDTLRATVRIALMPMVGVSYVALHTTTAEKLAILFGLIVLMLATVRILSRRRRRVTTG